MINLLFQGGVGLRQGLKVEWREKRTQVGGGVGQDEGCACKVSISYKEGIGGEKQMIQGRVP